MVILSCTGKGRTMSFTAPASGVVRIAFTSPNTTHVDVTGFSLSSDQRGRQAAPVAMRYHRAMLPLLLLTACAPSPDLSVTLDIVNEAGLPVDDAQLIVGRDTLFADGSRITVRDVTGPVSGVVSAPGHLDEPVLIGRSDDGTTRTVRLWDDSRWALHAGGDVMLGRRFTEPGGLLAEDVEVGALDVVSDLAPLFRAADVSVVNLETVLGDLALAGSYPGKRYVIGSPTRSVAALESLGVDVAVLANNHSRDWLDVGITSTRDVLRDRNIASVGARSVEDGVDDPVVLDVGGVQVGLLAYTTLDGDFVNQAYPGADDAPPIDLQDDARWQYEEREWSFDGPTVAIESDLRRIGPAWSLFEQMEDELADAERDDLFASLVTAYPEVQDWVARRGHGGAARWDDDSTAQIAALAASVDVVVVNLHAGYDLAMAPSDAMRDAARDAADAGAHLVVGHHPHVLQGAEWLGDTLVVHSLGNLVFDQENLTTRASAMLRTVWDGDALLEARLLPVELVDYRPVPVTDVAAARTIAQVAEASAAGWTARSNDDGLDLELTGPDGDPATVRAEHHTALLARDASVAEARSVVVRPGRVVDLPTGLVDPAITDATADVLVGRDLFGWGHFEDVLADGLDASGTHWRVDSEWEQVLPTSRARDGRRVLRLHRDVFSEGTVTTRSDGHVTLLPHRVWDGGVPLDPVATYAVRLRARQTGDAVASLRLQGFRYDRGSLAVDPETIELFDEDIPLDVGSGWRDLVIDVDPAWIEAGVNRLRPSVRLAPPERGSVELYVDAVQVLELRPAAQMPSSWGTWDVVRNDGPERVELTVSVR